jgi:hypothetical protein
MVENLEFTYSPNVKRDEVSEAAMRNNVDMWLRPLEQEINEKDVIVGVIFLSDNQRHITLLGADPDLYARFFNRMKEFVV